MAVHAAPRYDSRLRDALAALDDRDQPIAELWRRVGVVADGLGLPRPSYVHLRRLVHEERARHDDERARREAVRRVLLDAAGDLLVGRFVNAYEVADAVEDARRGRPP